MLAVQADKIDLIEVWAENDPTRGIRFGFAVSTLNGADNSAVAYTEVDVGKHTGMHNHSAEESHVVLEGTAEVVVGDDRQRLEKYGVAVVPALEFHEVVNVGSETLKVMTFFPSAAVVTMADQDVEPIKGHIFVTAPQE